jgi:hypothetical protein
MSSSPFPCSLLASTPSFESHYTIGQKQTVYLLNAARNLLQSDNIVDLARKNREKPPSFKFTQGRSTFAQKKKRFASLMPRFGVQSDVLYEA